MFTSARRYVKTSFIFLILGLLLGVHMIFQEHLLGRQPAPLLITAHTHVLLVGFMVMFIMGVAIWLFPRLGAHESSYRPELASLSYWLLTFGTILRFFSEVIAVYLAWSWLNVIIVTGACMQALGALVYVYSMWTRVKSVGSHLHEARGEKF
jgi:heme/copper-type cytochrome/quinol oxidase subunit 1